MMIVDVHETPNPAQECPILTLRAFAGASLSAERDLLAGGMQWSRELGAAGEGDLLRRGSGKQQLALRWIWISPCIPV